MKLSIGMMVKNESKYLERCLQSLQPLRDAIESELIIVDTGSTDNTIEIAKRFTDKVYFHKWNDDFSAMRNITISYATGEWFLVIDGDEVLEGAEQIALFLQSNQEKEYGVASIYVKNFTNGNDWSKFSLITSPRIFRKDENFKYVGAVHNQPVFSGKGIMVNSVLLHYGYLSTDAALMDRKFERTRQILEKELKLNAENIYYIYQLAVTYAMHKDFEQAQEAIEEAYNAAKKKNVNWLDHMYILTTRALIYQVLHNYKKVEDTCKEGIGAGGKNIDLFCLMGDALLSQGKNEEAMPFFERYIEIAEHYHEIPKDLSVIDYSLSNLDQVYSKMCVLWFEKGDLEKSLTMILAAKDEKIVVEAFKRIIDLHIETKRFEELAEYYTTVVLRRYPQYRVNFEQDMEFMRQYWKPSEEEDVAQAFAKTSTEYGFLHFTWLVNRGKSLEMIVMPNINLNGKPEFYGEVIHWALDNLKSRELFNHLLSTTTEEKWNQLVSYAYKTFEHKFFDRILGFVRGSKHVNNLFECQLAKTFARYALLFSLSNNFLRQEMLKFYLRYGCEYIEKLYRPEIIRQEKCNWLSNEEDKFFIMTWRAKRLLKKKKEEEFVGATKEILDQMPQMRNWCNFLEWKQALNER